MALPDSTRWAEEYLVALVHHLRRMNEPQSGRC